VDGCYERFGTDEEKCLAVAPRCHWYGEKGGKGKCALPREAKDVDGCYARFGTNEAKCDRMKCQWYGEKGGKGKCALPRSPRDVDGCYEKFGTDEEKCLAVAPRCHWYGEKGGKGKCALPREAKDVDGREGVVTLRASARDGFSHDDLHQELEANRGVIEMTLKAYLGYSSVKVQAIVLAGRRLHNEEEGLSFKVSFVASGTNTASGSGSFMQKLQSSFNAAGARVTFEGASVEWDVKPAPQTSADKPSQKSSYNSCSGYFILGSAIIGAVAALACGVLVLRKYCRAWARATNTVAKTENQEAVDCADIECAPVKTTTADEKAEGNWEVQSVSTGPPSSEEGVRSSGTNEAGGGPGSPEDEASNGSNANEILCM
jgi:hypothetical protein